MWYLTSISLAIIGSFVVWAGEPIGAILIVPSIVAGVWYDLKETNK